MHTSQNVAVGYCTAMTGLGGGEAGPLCTRKSGNEQRTARVRWPSESLMRVVQTYTERGTKPLSVYYVGGQQQARLSVSNVASFSS